MANFVWRADISFARNTIINDFIKTDCTHLFFYDDDNPMENPWDIDKLLEVNQPVVTGLVPSRLPDWSGVHRLCIFQQWVKESWELTYKQYINIPSWPEVFQIANCWMGCVLVRRDVVETIMKHFPRPCEMKMCTYFWSDEDNEWVRDELIDPSKIKGWMLRFKRYLSEDLLFFERAWDLGFPIYAHKGVKCTHLGEQPLVTIDTNINKANASLWLFKLN